MRTLALLLSIAAPAAADWQYVCTVPTRPDIGVQVLHRYPTRQDCQDSLDAINAIEDRRCRQGEVQSCQKQEKLLCGCRENTGL